MPKDAMTVRQALWQPEIEGKLAGGVVQSPHKQSDKASHHDSKDIFNVVKFGRLIDASGDAEAQRSSGRPWHNHL